MVTCLDISENYIMEAEERAQVEGLTDKLSFVVGDAFQVDRILEEELFDAACMTWSTLLGYKERKDDLQLLSATNKVVRDEGLLVIANTVSRDLVVKRSLARCPSKFLSDLDDIVVVENPKFNPIESRIENTWTFYRREGRDLRYLGEFWFKMRVYTLSEAKELAEEADWEFLEAYHSLDALEPPREDGSPINAVFKKRSLPL